MEFFLPDGEKRIFPRARLNMCCELSTDISEKTVQGRCLDLSASGARVLVNQAFEAGQEVMFRLKEHLGQESFRAKAVITRIEKTTLQGRSADKTENSDTSGGKKQADRFCLGLRITMILQHQRDL